LHVITRRKLLEFVAAHTDAEAALDTWYRVSRRATWQNLADVKETYPHADYVAPYTVFNIRGNNYRLIVEIFYDDQTLLVRHVLTHEEYDEGRWKK